MEAGRARALTRVGRAAEARTSIEPAIALGEATLAKRPRDLGYRKALAEGYLAYGEVLSRPAQTGGATTRWARALVLVDSLARASKETDVLALQASAMLQLGGRDDARPAVGELAKRGYRRPSYVALVRANGL